MAGVDKIDGLEDPPSPNKQMALMAVCVIAAIYFWSLLPLIIAAASSGWYFGNYQGRFVVMRAWIGEKQARLETLRKRASQP